MGITDRVDAITRITPERLRAAAPVPKSVKIEVSPRCNYRCLAGDTLIDTIYGPIPIKELAELRETVPVYTYRDGMVFIADAIDIRKYGTQEALVRVLFDDGTHIDCTPDHKFLQFRSLGNVPGTEEWPTEAQHLKPGSRVRAFRENLVGGGYTTICCGRTFRRKRYRLVMDYLLGRELARDEYAHHIDHNPANDHPSNLEYLGSVKEHVARHPEIAERMRTNNPARNMTPEWAAKIRAGLSGKRRTLEQRLRYRESKIGPKNPNYIDGRDAGRTRIDEINHKVISVEPLDELGDTYCLSVRETGWFFANKVLVKNCGFCALRTREQQPRWDMDFDLFKRITAEMRAAGVEEIGLFYLGESFMNPRLLVDCVKYLKAEVEMPYVFLTSNASMAFPEAVTACMASGLDSLKWSVNAADAEQFKRVMGVSGKLFHRALGNIKAAHDVRGRHGHKTGLYASSIRYDGAQQEKMEALLNEHVRPYVDDHYWLPLYSMGAFAADREAELGYRPTAGNQGRLAALREPLPCWAVFTEGHVTADGKLSACCFDATANWTMGDLTRQSFMEAWHSPAFIALRQAHIARDVTGTVCQDCVAYAG